jgi:hypothetical protein
MSSNATRTAYGMSFSGPSQTGGNDGPMIDTFGNGTGNFVSDLSAYKTQGIKAVLKFVGAPSNYQASDLSFRLDLWKGKMDEAAAKTNAQQMGNFVQDGTLLGNWMMDDCKPGSVIFGGNPPTLADLDEMARYSKSLWSQVPTFVRVDNNFLAGKSDWSYLDAGWCQWHEKWGDVGTWFRSNVNDGRRVGLGLMGGFNLLDGGSGLTAPWNVHPNKANFFGMSPQEIDAVGLAMSQQSFVIGVFGWSALPAQDTTDYYSVPTIQDALDRLKDRMVGRLQGPINWRDQSPSGSTDTGSGSTVTVRGNWSIRDDGLSTLQRANNANEMILPAPANYQAGDAHFILAYSRDSGRSFLPLSGWSTAKSVSGNSAQGGQLVLYNKIGSASETPLTVESTGLVAGTSVMARWFVVSGNSSVLGNLVVAGSAGTWASKTGMGPIPGIASTRSDALVMICMARTDDFGNGSVDENVMSATTGPQTWSRLFSSGCAAGNDAGIIVDYASTNGLESITTKSWTQTTGSAAGSGCGFMVTIAPAAVLGGTPPVLILGDLDDGVTISLGSTVSFTLSSTGSTPITYSKESGPSNVTLGSSTGAFQWTPQSAGDYVIVLAATNSFGSDTGTLPVSVSSPGGSGSTSTGANSVPVITHPGNKAVNAHDLLSFVVGATDADDDHLTFGLDAGAPTGAFIDSTTGQFIWIPSGEQGPGTYPIVVLVGDGQQTSRSTFTVTVGDTVWTRNSTAPTNSFRRI